MLYSPHMDASAKHEVLSPTGIVPDRLADKARRSDFYFRPDAWVDSLVAQVEVTLEDTLHSGHELMDHIGRHMLFAHAKRLRPIFVLLAQHLFLDDTLQKAVDCAAAAELIHCASLFHDDVIDNADFRKGKRAANAVWGNKRAVIMGDHFFVLAYRLLTKHRDISIMELYIEMCSALARGVMKEIENTGRLDITEQIHFKTIEQKTADFFSTCAVIGGLIGGADAESEKHLDGFGLNFGMAFQLSDDLLDLFSDPLVTGKPRGSDLRSGVYTIPIIHALNNFPDFSAQFKPVLEERAITEGEIDEIAEILKSNGTMEYSLAQVSHHADLALAHLAQLPSGKANDSFRDLLEKIVKREY